jgi:hypothetical protein
VPLTSFATAAAWIAAVVGITCNIPYFIAIVRGTTQPSPVAYGVQSVSGIARVISLIAISGLVAAALPIAFTLGTIATFILSFKYGKKANSRYDKILIGAAATSMAASIIAYALFGSVVGHSLFIVLSTLSIFTGHLATIAKQREHPRTESALTWAMVLVAGVVSMAAIVADGEASIVTLFPGVQTSIASSIILGIEIVQQRRHRTAIGLRA